MRDKAMQDIEIRVSGMSCGHCLNAVNRAISSVPGVQVKSVRIGQAEVKVTDPAATDRVKVAIEEAGYRVEAITGV
jgi:copper chaperone